MAQRLCCYKLSAVLSSGWCFHIRVQNSAPFPEDGFEAYKFQVSEFNHLARTPKSLNPQIVPETTQRNEVLWKRKGVC
jgi:hypothetical protein